MFDDSSGDVGVRGIVCGLAVRDESPNPTLVIRFFGGIIFLLTNFIFFIKFLIRKLCFETN